MQPLTNQTINSSLLDQLTADDVQELIEQEQLMKSRKVRIHYAIDHYEISEYCFPLGFTDTDKEIDLDIVADQQAALSGLVKHKLLFLDEYRPELNGLYDYVRRAIERATDNELKLLIKQLPLQEEQENFTRADRNIQDYVEQQAIQNLPQILAICLGFAKDGINKLRILDNNHLVFDYTDRQRFEEWDPSLKKAVENSVSNPITVPMLQEYREKESATTTIHNPFLNTPSLQKYSKRKRNAEVDAKAVSRILQINKYLYNCYRNGETKDWHFFQLISSASFFADILTKLDTFKSNLFAVDNIKLMPYRTLSQRYLWMLCAGDNRQIELENFKQFKQYDAEKRNLKGKLIEGLFNHYTTSANTLFNRVHTVRRDYERTGLLANYFYNSQNSDGESPVRQLLQRFNKLRFKDQQDRPDLDLMKRKELFKMLLRVVEKEAPTNIDELKKDKFLYSNQLPQESSYHNRLLIGLTDLQKHLENSSDGTKFQLHRGNDPVQGSFQHSPIAFHIHEQFKPTLELIIKVFLESVIDRKQLQKTFGSLLKNLIEKDYSYETINRNIRYDEKIMLFITILLLPRYQFDDKPDPDLYVWINVVINDIKKELDLVSNNRPELKYKEQENLIAILIEYYYVAIWLARRLEYYDDSKRLIEEGKQLVRGNEDARFVHGECLLNYCYALGAIDKNQTGNQLIRWLTKTYEHSEKAINLLHKPGVSFTYNVTQYLNASLFNTSAYVKALLAKYDDASLAADHLREADRRLAMLQLFGGYERYQEFLHTEVVILEQRLNASDYLIGSQKREEAKAEALDLIDKIIQLRATNKIKLKIDDLPQLQSSILQIVP